jgi:hypothetical protein
MRSRAAAPRDNLRTRRPEPLVALFGFRWTSRRIDISARLLRSDAVGPAPPLRGNSAKLRLIPEVIMPDSEILIRLVIAAALGSLIGFERERLLWAAGIRTHMLVCVGSCLIMVVSQYGFSNILTQQNIVLDPSRIAAQVVSGIGFLGAVAILARGEIVKGLTTAASIWTVAAVGLAVGGGLYLAASASTVIVLIILVGIKPPEEA